MGQHPIDLIKETNTKAKGSAVASLVDATDNSHEDSYNVIKENWYSILPYTFSIKKYHTEGSSRVFFNLPINPQNIQITTNFATNIYPSLYGVIEEHSDIRFYDIAISGTTGIAPKSYGFDSELTDYGIVGGRMSTSDPDLPLGDWWKYKNKQIDRIKVTKAGITRNAGFLTKTLGSLNAAKNNAFRIATILSDTFLSTGALSQSGVAAENTGYLAFHNLYRALLAYKKDVLNPKTKYADGEHPLIFINNKDNTQYNVAIKTFTLVRSVDNPTLYNYNIQMTGYSLQTAGSAFASEDTTEFFKEEFGLNGIGGGYSFKGMAVAASKEASRTLSALSSLSKVAGR